MDILADFYHREDNILATITWWRSLLYVRTNPTLFGKAEISEMGKYSIRYRNFYRCSLDFHRIIGPIITNQVNNELIIPMILEEIGN